MIQESFGDQIRTVRERFALFEDPSRGILEVSGATVVPYLQRMTSQEIPTQSIGTGCYNALLDRKGMVLSIFYQIRTEETKFLLFGNRLAISRAHEILQKYKLMEKVEIADLSHSWRALSLIGPGAEAAASRLKKSFSVVPDGTFRIPVWHVVGPTDVIGAILEGAELREISPIEPRVIKLLQMEVGFPEYGVDIDERHILLEAQAPIAYKRQKGCYPGQEVVERILAYGKGRAPRTLCSLRITGELEIPAQTDVLVASGEKAGWTTSALFNPVDSETVVLASIEHKFLESDLTIQHQRARVVPSNSA